MKLWLIFLFLTISCSNEKNSDLSQSLFISAVKSVKATITGKVAKGSISQARVDAYRLNSDGTCNTSAGNLGSTITDSTGDYKLTYLKTGAPICVIAVPNGYSKMYDEGTGTEIDWTGSTSLTMIMREPSGNSKSGMNLTPFSRIIASRLAAIAKANKGTAILDKQVTYANKAVAVMFGFTKRFGKSVRAESSAIDMDKLEDIFDSGINLNDSSNSMTKYANALLGAISVAAGKTKKSAKITSDDVEKYVAALAEDIVDGTADGTNSKGEALSVNGTAMSSTPLTGTLMTSLTEYVNSKPSLGITSAEASAASFNQSPVFLQVLPVEIATCATDSSKCVWTDFTIASSAADNDWYGVTYGNVLFVAVAATGTGNRVMTSPDGINWTIRTSAADNDWRAVTYGNGLFVATANTGTGNRVMTSPDGINWTIRTSAADNSWWAVTYGNGLFVAVASSGAGNRVMTSPDGINWTVRTSAADNGWSGVTYGNGLFVAVAYTGTGNRVMTSPDGINWTIRTSAADNDWRDVTYGNGLFVAVTNTGTGNRVMTSPDGINWTLRTSAADNSWVGGTYGNGLFVAVASSGAGNRVMTSPDGINWTIRPSAAANNWYGVTYGNGLFVAVAYTGTGNRVMYAKWQ